MLRIGLCDDEVEAREAIRFELEKDILAAGEEIVYEFSSGKSAVRWLIKHPGEIDLLFLDVEMDGMNGMETARRIREFDRELLIVFVTGYSDYVFEGYEVGALDYVLKPAFGDKLLRILARVRELLESGRDGTFVFKNTDGTFRMKLRNIDYFYSDKRKVVLAAQGREYPFYSRLDEVQERLGGKFVRIHQRYLVNPMRVEHIGRDAVSIGDTQLPVSRNLKEEALSKLAEAMLGG